MSWQTVSVTEWEKDQSQIFFQSYQRKSATPLRLPLVPVMNACVIQFIVNEVMNLILLSFVCGFQLYFLELYVGK